MMPLFGNEIVCIEVRGGKYYYTHTATGNSYCKSWFEPEPEPEEWFEVVAHERGAISPKRWTSLVKDKEDFFSFGHKEDDF